MIFLKFSYYYYDMTEKIGKMAEDSTNKKTENLVGSLQTEFPYAMCRYRIIVFWAGIRAGCINYIWLCDEEISAAIRTTKRTIEKQDGQLGAQQLVK